MCNLSAPINKVRLSKNVTCNIQYDPSLPKCIVKRPFICEAACLKNVFGWRDK